MNEQTRNNEARSSNTTTPLTVVQKRKDQKLVTIRDRSAMAQVKQTMNMLNEENIETVTGIIIFVWKKPDQL